MPAGVVGAHGLFAGRTEARVFAQANRGRDASQRRDAYEYPAAVAGEQGGGANARGRARAAHQPERAALAAAGEQVGHRLQGIGPVAHAPKAGGGETTGTRCAAAGVEESQPLNNAGRSSSGTGANRKKQGMASADTGKGIRG